MHIAKFKYLTAGLNDLHITLVDEKSGKYRVRV